MPKPGSPEWIARLEALLAAEAEQPEAWWYLSFVKDEFLGACIVRARGMTTAIRRAHALGINPGGQVMAIEVDSPRDFPVDRLLTRAELGEGATVGELAERGILPGTNTRFSD